MATFQPEGGERRSRREAGRRSDVTLTDDHRQTEAGIASSGVGLLSLAFSGLSALYA